ncbi:MAG: F-type +-transporting ATPase subunit c [Candidatus Saccharibacteria bacterium]|nr:F-type +-transporting ATPase subunit c [Candidatus Saccharibacteria bacterium]
MLHQVFAAATDSPLANPTFVKGMAIAIGTIMPAFSLGWIGSSVMKAIGRNPEVAGRILPILLISAALVEAIAIYVLVVVFTV